VVPTTGLCHHTFILYIHTYDFRQACCYVKWPNVKKLLNQSPSSNIYPVTEMRQNYSTYDWLTTSGQIQLAAGLFGSDGRADILPSNLLAVFRGV